MKIENYRKNNLIVCKDDLWCEMHRLLKETRHTQVHNLENHAIIAHYASQPVLAASLTYTAATYEVFHCKKHLQVKLSFFVKLSVNICYYGSATLELGRPYNSVIQVLVVHTLQMLCVTRNKTDKPLQQYYQCVQTAINQQKSQNVYTVHSSTALL